MTSDWQREIDQATRQEDWALSGSKRVVKVVPLGRSCDGSAGGYITLAKFLNGRTPQQIERDLGLPANFLVTGVEVWSFARLPNPSEYDYELTAKFPDGLHYNPPHSDEAYPPGSDKIHQWKIKDGAHVPVDTSKTVTAAPGQVVCLV